MTIEQSELEEDGAWTGEAISLERPYDGRLAPGEVSNNLRLPERHVHPAVREATEQVVRAQAKRDALAAKLAARPGEREQLAYELEESDPDSPKWVAAVHRLQEFDAETKYIETLIPRADIALQQAWAAPGGAVAAVGADWDAEIDRRGSEHAAAAQRDLQSFLWHLYELRMLDQLKAREGILHQPAAAPETYARNERSGSIDRLVGGEDRGTEGRVFGAAALVAAYTEVFAPKPAPELEPEPEPEEPASVRYAKQRYVGPNPMGRDRDPFLVSD